MCTQLICIIQFYVCTLNNVNFNPKNGKNRKYHDIFLFAMDEKDGSGQKSKRHGARRHVTRIRLSANNQRLLPDEG